ncbi:glycosyltransferase family 4 protein [Sphingobium amiense]|nr:glycosyltransferase family 4 protein [Sphingobium amiense]
MTGPVTVAILLSEGRNSRGGIGRVIGYLVRGLHQAAPDIRVRQLAARPTVAPVVKHLTVPLWMALFAIALIRDRVDIVHINVAPRGSTWRKMAYAALARRLGKRVLLHLHGSAYDEYFQSLGKKRQDMVRRFFGSADKVVTLSERWTRFMIDDLRVAPGRVVEIANGVPAAPDLHSPVAGGVTRIAFFGAVGHRKGTDILLEALAALAARGVAFEAVIGGDGDVEPMRDLARKLSLGDRVRFLGWVDEQAVDRELRQSDIFVLPSRAENQPVSILEAMARALPVVATRVGAIPRQVEDGVTGLLVEAGDADGLTGALARLAQDAELRGSMGQAGLAQFRARFSVEACAARFGQLYREMAGRPPR